MDLFESHAERALELAPYDAKFFTESGALIAFSGQWERGNKLVEKAFQLNQEAAAGWYHSTKFYYNYLKGEYQTALEYIR